METPTVLGNGLWKSRLKKKISSECRVSWRGQWDAQPYIVSDEEAPRKSTWKAPISQSGDGNLDKVLSHENTVCGVMLSSGSGTPSVTALISPRLVPKVTWSIPSHPLFSHRLTEFKSMRRMKRPEKSVNIWKLRLTQKEKSGNWYTSIV